MVGSLRRDRMIAATVTSGFAWFAAWLPLSLGLGLFFGPPGAGPIEFAILVVASVWLVWRKPLVAAGWVPSWGQAGVGRPYWPLIIPRPSLSFAVLAPIPLAFARTPRPRIEAATPTPCLTKPAPH